MGGATAASLQTLVPRSVLNSVAGRGLISVLALAGLAVILAISSEADAFVAASLTQFSLTARLAFMVVGPMVDVKLVALQAGTFSPRFARRFAPPTLPVAARRAAVGRECPRSPPPRWSGRSSCDRGARRDLHARRRRPAAADVQRDLRALRPP